MKIKAQNTITLNDVINNNQFSNWLNDFQLEDFIEELEKKSELTEQEQAALEVLKAQVIEMEDAQSMSEGDSDNFDDSLLVSNIVSAMFMGFYNNLADLRRLLFFLNYQNHYRFSNKQAEELSDIILNMYNIDDLEDFLNTGKAILGDELNFESFFNNDLNLKVYELSYLASSIEESKIISLDLKYTLLIYIKSLLVKEQKMIEEEINRISDVLNNDNLKKIEEKYMDKSYSLTAEEVEIIISNLEGECFKKLKLVLKMLSEKGKINPDKIRYLLNLIEQEEDKVKSLEELFNLPEKTDYSQIEVPRGPDDLGGSSYTGVKKP